MAATRTSSSQEAHQGPVYLAIGLALSIAAVMGATGFVRTVNAADRPAVETQIAEAAFPLRIE